MNVLFVYSIDEAFSLSKPLMSQTQIQFGISSISSVLKTNGHNTQLLILSKTLGKHNHIILNRTIREFTPGIICFTAVSTEYGFITGIAQAIRRDNPDIYLVIGGAHVSLNPEGVLEHGFDALCIGEGEYPLLTLTDKIQQGQRPTGIPNLWIRNNGHIQKNRANPFINDLDRLPFPDRGMWQPFIAESDSANHPVLLGRGCPFQCTYCCNHAFRKLAPGQYVRFRSPANIVDEIHTIRQTSPAARNFYLEVETIAVNRKWALSLCAELEKYNAGLDSPISFGVNLRVTPNAKLDELFQAFRRANFSYVNIGLESGSERVRREILNRNYTNQDIIETVELARKHGMKVSFFNMIGLPGETLAEHFETVRINRICKPDWYSSDIFYPYPGTNLHKLCIDKGYMTAPLASHSERKKAFLSFPGFTRKQIQDAYIWFDYRVGRGFKPLSGLLRSALRKKLRSLPLYSRIWNKLRFLRRG